LVVRRFWFDHLYLVVVWVCAGFIPAHVIGVSHLYLVAWGGVGHLYLVTWLFDDLYLVVIFGFYRGHLYLVTRVWFVSLEGFVWGVVFWGPRVRFWVFSPEQFWGDVGD